MPPSRQAGILSSDRAFRTFVAKKLDLDLPGPATTGVAAEFIRQTARVESRAELDKNKPAAARFQSLRTEFDAWRGRLPQQNRS